MEGLLAFAGTNIPQLGGGVAGTGDEALLVWGNAYTTIGDK